MKIADRLASATGQQTEADYLRRFRIICRNLAASAVGVSMESAFGAMSMGMPPGIPQPNPAELLDRTDRELEALGG